MEILWIALIIAGWAVIRAVYTRVSGLLDSARKYKRLKPKLDGLEHRESALTARASFLDKRAEDIITLSRQKSIGFPWLAQAYAEYFYLEDLKIAHELETKSRPALAAAEKVREAAMRRREAEQTARTYKYQILYYESLFPWLVEFKSDEVEDKLIQIRSGNQNQDDDDPAKKWLTPEEFKLLSVSEKNQLALDRYWSKKKSKWEVGRDYERYVGYKFESHGCKVRYQGIIEGFSDLGRDLIVVNGDVVRIVQCKHWSKNKTIHEKHIFQLYGTFLAYSLEHPTQKVQAHFITSTSLSDTARKFAEVLKIKVTENLPLAQYPCIKCNISKRNGERIYHLPFDQQYDKTIVEVKRGELYASTVAEAESKGFRRAFRYRGDTSTNT